MKILRPYLRKNAFRCYLNGGGEKWIASFERISDEASSHTMYELFNTIRRARVFSPGELIAIVGGTLIGAVLVSYALLLPVVVAVLIFWAIRESRKNVFVDYAADNNALVKYQLFSKQIAQFNMAQGLWLQFGKSNAESKRRRFRATCATGLPAGIKSNLEFPVLSCDSCLLYFSPDSLILQTEKNVTAISYRDIELIIENGVFTEEDSKISDAQIIGYEHLHVANNGQRDVKHKSNPLLPVHEYPVIKLRSKAIDVSIVASNQLAFSAFDFNRYVGHGGVVPQNTKAPVPAVVGAMAPEKVDGPDAINKSPMAQQKLLTEVKLPGEKVANEYSIPKPGYTPMTIERRNDSIAPQENLTDFWITKGTAVVVHGVNIRGGLLYYCPAQAKQSHPSLVEGGIPVREVDADYGRNIDSYYPTYREIGPAERYAWLLWLGSARDDPNTAISYVFLYFYAIERRLLIDAGRDALAKAEVPVLLGELRRLLEVYSTNRSFKSYCSKLISFAGLVYELPESYFLNVYTECVIPSADGKGTDKLPQQQIQIALAQLASRRLPITSEWVFLWIQRHSASLDKSISADKPFFNKVFSYAFEKRYPDGDFPVSLPAKPLELTYKAAGKGLNEVRCQVGRLMDLEGDPSNLDRLRELISDVAALTASYCKSRRKVPASSVLIEHVLLMPACIWPPKITEKISQFIGGKEFLEVALSDLISHLGLKAANRQQLIKLFSGLAQLGIYSEPSILSGITTPKSDDTIVLFSGHLPNEQLNPLSGGYSAAEVFAELSTGLLKPDEHVDIGYTSIVELLRSWPGLTLWEISTIQAKLLLLMKRPPAYVKAKSKIKQLSSESIDLIGRMLIVLSDPNAKSKSELLVLEKLFGVLGIPKKLYTFMHESSPSNKFDTPAFGQQKVDSGILDFEKIAFLQQETKQVSSMLSTVFIQDDLPGENLPVSVPVQQVKIDTRFEVFSELSTKQHSFLKQLLNQKEWVREDLLIVAKGIGVMLDGVLDAVNEICLDQYDDKLTEGDSLIRVNQEISVMIIESANK